MALIGNKEYFKGINEIKFEGKDSKNPFAFKYYNPDKVLIESVEDKSYVTLNLDSESIGDNTGTYIVPENHYFMMGDNRDNSLDSRFIEQVGYVPYENLIGRADFLFFSP